MSPAAQQTQLITALSTCKTAPKWSFSGRKDLDRSMQTPGPGAYTSVAPDASKYTKASRVVFGTSQRETIRTTTVPGPGQYAPGDHLASSPRFGFGTAKRQGMARMNGNPGPGAYQPAGVLGTEGAKYSVTGRREEKDRTIQTPGPGTYQPKDDGRAGVEKPPTWSFGTSPRAGIAGGHHMTPGPGAYEPKSQMGKGPAFSIKARRAEGPGGTGLTPGPGAHGGMYTQFGY